MGLRDRLRRAERVAEGEMVTRLCRRCGQELRVAGATDLEYLAWEWTQETGEKAYRKAPWHPGVFVLAEHPHGVEELVYEATGEPWPSWRGERA